MSTPKKSRFAGMSKTTTVRYPDDLEDKIQVLRCRPGGVSKFFVEAVRKLKVGDDEIAAARLLRR